MNKLRCTFQVLNLRWWVQLQLLLARVVRVGKGWVGASSVKYVKVVFVVLVRSSSSSWRMPNCQLVPPLTTKSHSYRQTDFAMALSAQYKVSEPSHQIKLNQVTFI